MSMKSHYGGVSAGKGPISCHNTRLFADSTTKMTNLTAHSTVQVHVFLITQVARPAEHTFKYLSASKNTL